MLELTGTFNGESLDGKIVPVKKIADAYGIDLSKPLEFDLDKSQISWDKLNKRDRYGASRRYPTVFTGNGPEGELQIRYYKTKVLGKDKVPNYTPDRIRYDGKRMVVHDPELALFFALNPMCGTSPFSRKGKTRWNQIDQAAISKKKLAEEKANFDIVGKIYSEKDISLLRRKALGMQLNTDTGKVSVPDAANADPDTLKFNMVKLAQKYPKPFADAYSDTETMFYGTLREGINKGIVHTVTLTGGVQSWVFRRDINMGEEIVRVPRSQDPFTALASACVDPLVWKKVNAAIIENSASANIKEGIANLEKGLIESGDPEEVVTKAIADGLLWIEGSTVKMKKNIGNHNTLLNLDEPGNWEDQVLSKVLEKPDGLTYTKIKKQFE